MNLPRLLERYLPSLLVVIIVQPYCSLPAVGQVKGSRPEPRPASPQVTWAKRALQGFDMRVWLSNQMAIGGEAWDGQLYLQNPPFGLEYPPGSGIEHLYGGGPWLGAVVNGVRRVTEGYNGNDAMKYFLPDTSDRIYSSSIGDPLEPNRAGIDDDGDASVDEDPLDGRDNDGDWVMASGDVGADGIPDSLETGCKGPFDAFLNPDPAYDNYDPSRWDSCGLNRLMNDKSLYTENNGQPDHGEPFVDEDYAAFSDKDVYCRADDQHPQAGHFPMGAEVDFQSYAWSPSTAAHAIVLLDYAFENIGSLAWEDAFVGYFADMDVGPTAAGSYYVNNYSAYDSATGTVFIHNPIDSGSTPLGLTLLGTSRPLDSLEFSFHWFNFTTKVIPDQSDSTLYAWLTCQTPLGVCVDSNESPESPSDTRFLISSGPFQVQPGETLRAAYALVSGYTVREMLSHAVLARRLYESGKFIMPRAYEADSAVGGGFALAWDALERSPYGDVVSYRAYAGTAPGVWTDSITTAGSMAVFEGLAPGVKYYFSVAAIDDKGNLGALSREVSFEPAAPLGVAVEDGDDGITIKWMANAEPDIAGYNVYRRTVQSPPGRTSIPGAPADTSFEKVNAALIVDTAFVDANVAGNTIYAYVTTAVDKGGNESERSDEMTGRLIPPGMPLAIALGPGAASITIGWTSPGNDDIVGYNIYRRASTGGGAEKLNDVPIDTTLYRDTDVAGGTVYWYSLETVDSALNTSDRSAEIEAYPASPGTGILVLNNLQVTPLATLPAAASFYDSLLSKYAHTVTPRIINMPFLNVTAPESVYNLIPYSTVLLMVESAVPSAPPLAYPVALRGYLLAGGNLVISGRMFSAPGFYPRFDLISEYFGLNETTVRPVPEALFGGAWGEQDFPDVTADSARLAYYGGSLNSVEIFDSVPAERVLARYASKPFRDTVEGKPVGVRAVDSSVQAYYFSFPMLALRIEDAKALMTKILTDFGEFPTGVEGEPPAALPQVFRLEQAYPNPFNPAAAIRYQLPVESRVVLRIYDALGRVVSELKNEIEPPGYATVQWDASSCASGVYFYRLEAASTADPSNVFSDVRKMVLIR